MPYRIVWKSTRRLVPVYMDRTFKTKRQVQSTIHRNILEKKLSYRKVPAKRR